MIITIIIFFLSAFLLVGVTFSLLDGKFFANLLWGPTHSFPNTRRGSDTLPWEALTRCVLILGSPSSGKTRWMAKHVLDYAKAFPDRPIFILDVRGGLTKEVLRLVLLEPPEVREALTKRLIVDALNHPNYVLTTAEFSTDYGWEMEEQVERVVLNLERLNHELIEQNPTMGRIPLQEVGKNIFRLLGAIRDEIGENWQITEAKRLIMEDGLRKWAVNKFGQSVPATKWYFEKFFEEMSDSERYKRTAAFISVLGAIESNFIRAKLGGSSKPAVIPKQIIDQGQIYMMDGSAMANLKTPRDYLFMQAYTLIKGEIDRRMPDDPNDKPVSLILDEGLSMLKIPSMAMEIADMPSQNRARKLQFYIALQELNQVSLELRPSLWTFGNIVSFAMTNVDDAKVIAEQLFSYIPERVKLQAKVDYQQPITEVHTGQIVLHANAIQHLKHRECIIRTLKNERDPEKYVRWIPRTTEVPQDEANVWEFKERLIKEHGVPIRQVLREISQRHIGGSKPERPTTQVMTP
jgi:hypothetical protein